MVADLRAESLKFKLVTFVFAFNSRLATTQKLFLFKRTEKIMSKLTPNTSIHGKISCQLNAKARLTAFCFRLVLACFGKWPKKSRCTLCLFSFCVESMRERLEDEARWRQRGKLCFACERVIMLDYVRSNYERRSVENPHTRCR